MTQRLGGKTAFITGSTQGIGKGIALALAGAGAKVAINGLEESAVARMVQEVRQAQGEALAIPGDISRPGFAQEAFAKIEAHWGIVDILVNNAAIEFRKSSLDFSPAEYDQMMDVNLKAAFFLAQRALPSMVKQNWGRIINISSIHAHKPNGFCSIYSMSKAGLLMMTRELALEFSAFGITVNCIAPGAIRTDMNRAVLSDPVYEKKVKDRIPAGLIGEVKDVAQLALFIASDEAKYLTGGSYSVDGGLGM